MKPAAAFLLVFAIAMTPAVAAEREASCVKVELLDQDNLPIKGQAEVVGLLVGGKPILPGNLPQSAAIRPGLPAPCPAALVEEVAESYKESCLTRDRRSTTAKSYNVTPESVAAQCQTIRDSLGESLTAYLK